ncbi:hypothetical protein [Mesorhizobium xinjiangense]|uniref:hypothetical protein n=1 Tax=Mesorhizobium xinjiangense TaxID=2678685 RepID=UPI0012ED8DCD|nr:hypothetical protein [Mesorhizobium xinjiangense]
MGGGNDTRDILIDMISMYFAIPLAIKAAAVLATWAVFGLPYAVAVLAGIVVSAGAWAANEWWLNR